MTTVTIEHDAERFAEALTDALADPDHGGVMAAVDVVASDTRPGELMLVVQDDVTREWVSDGRRYIDYLHAFKALGRHLDAVNPEHKPLSHRWTG